MLYLTQTLRVRRKGESQAGYLACLADGENLTSQEGPLSLISWHCGRCRRVARSSLSAVAQVGREAQEEGEYVRLVVVDLLFQDANMSNANERIAHLPGALVLDCKALFDGSLEASQVHSVWQTSDQHSRPWLAIFPFPQPKHICIGFTVKLN